MPRPKRQLSRKVHKRLRKQQRRRASRASVLNVPWAQYYELLKQFEKLVLAAQRKTEDTQSLQIHWTGRVGRTAS